MAFEHYIRSGGKRLLCGDTTGTCAALAAHGTSLAIFLSAGYERSRLYDPAFTTGYREGQP